MHIVKTYRKDIKNMHCVAPEYEGKVTTDCWMLGLAKMYEKIGIDTVFLHTAISIVNIYKIRVWKFQYQPSFYSYALWKKRDISFVFYYI